MQITEDLLKADLVLINGQVICMDSAKTIAQALAVKDKKIIAVGSSDDIRSLSGGSTEVVDLAGRAVVPGMTEGHVHSEWYGKDQMMTSFKECKTEQEALEILKKKVAETKPGEWVAASSVPDGVMAPGEGGFTLKEVDPITPDHPVFIDCASVGHYSWMNGYALRLFNITKDTYPPEITGGGGIVKDTNGEPTGRIEGDAWNWAVREIKPYTFDFYLKALEKAEEDFLKVGLTAAHDSWEDPYILKGWQTLEAQGKLRVRHFVSLDMERYSDLFISAGMRTGFGSDMLRLQQFKIILNVPPHAAVFEDYVGMPGNRGYHLYPPEWVEEKVLNAVKNGWSVVTHIAGDRDLDMVITAYEKAIDWYKKETGKDNTSLRLQCCHYSMSTPSLIERTAAAKIVANSRPIGKLSPIDAPGGRNEKIYGRQRWESSRPVKALFDAGINVNFGNDYPAPWGFIDPLSSIYAAIHGGHGRPWDAITPYQALQAYTINGAYGVFSEDRFGSIEPGKFADLVVYSDNPLTVPKEKLWDPVANTPKDLLVDYTIVGGKIEYKRQ